MSDRTILHVDMNAFYASVECLHEPKLRKFPVAVSGNKEKRHGIILAKNELAKSFGIKTGETIGSALQKCPNLQLVAANYPLYLKYAKLSRAIYSRYTNKVEPFGLDEAWLDVSPNDGVKYARTIADVIKYELGVTVSVGISWCKVLAKLASDLCPPDNYFLIDRASYAQLSKNINVENLLFVGSATRKRLRNLGIYTIADLALASPLALKNYLGKVGINLSAFARGEETSEVKNFQGHKTAKSIGNGITTPKDLENIEAVNIVLCLLCESIASRLRESQLTAKAMSLSVRDKNLFTSQHQLQFSDPCNTYADLVQYAKNLFSQHSFSEAIRSLSVRVFKLSAPSYERISFLPDYQFSKKALHLDKTIDEIRLRYGYSSIKRCLLLKDGVLGGVDAKNHHNVYPASYY